MIIIHGEQGTGKSTLATNLLKNKKNSLYLILEDDSSLIKKLKTDDINFSYIKSCHLMDLKYALLEYGGLLNNRLDYVVIDSINLIEDRKSYKKKIDYIEQLEKDFKLKIALVFNTLNRMDKTIEFIQSLKFKLIDTNPKRQFLHLQSLL